MIDITSEKIAVPAALFALFSPGIIVQFPYTTKFNTLQTSFKSVLFHALVFMIVYHFVAKSMGIVLSKNDLIIPGILFVLLSPGMLLTLPQGSKGMYFSGQTSLLSSLVHALVFAIVFALLRKQFPSYY
jgi:hypothetical protein